MRRAARVDANHPDIVAALKAAGASVQSLAQIGDGCPDILAGFRGKNFLFEVKSDNGEINELQRRWHIEWRAPVFVVYTADEALRALGVIQ